jgi:alpha-galactosidase
MRESRLEKGKCGQALTVLTAFAMAASLSAGAQTKEPAASQAATKLFRLDGGDVTYAMGVNARGELQTVYWGRRLVANDPLPEPIPVSFAGEINDTEQEFPGWGGGVLDEPALKITFPDGNRDLVLHFQSEKIENGQLLVELRDISRDVFVTLHYKIDADTGILARWATIDNRTNQKVMVEQAESAIWNLPAGTDYSLRYLAGRWGGEFQLQSQKIEPGSVELESRRGYTGHQSSPWFAVERDGATETAGSVWFGALAWSGSWRITVQQDPEKQVRIAGGFNPFDFGYPLAPGEQLETPVFYGGYTRLGFGEASRLLHHFEITSILPQAPHPRPRPVLYNSWEATEFEIDEQGQEQLAEKAASIGVERFVMDDGWFGQRKNDRAGLGDWYVNPQKFPHGLGPLIAKVHSLGMDFGLWVEPEMVNPDSDLYRLHPDWVINFTGRPRTEARNQLVLNLARPEVRDYVFSVLDHLLSENQIAFLKWDLNRPWAEPGWPEVAPDEEKKLYVIYTRNYYSILAELRRKHPNVEIESCSGGGGRVDLGVLHYVNEIWTSDNTDPFDRLSIQNGFTYAYTPGVMMSWVTDSPNWFNHRTSSLPYRFLSSMQGSLGIGANLNHWTQEDFATAKQMIVAYKQIREVVQHGLLYRLVSPQSDGELSATESVAPDRSSAVVFTFLHSQQLRFPTPTVFPEGLDSRATYSIHPLYGRLESAAPAKASGAYWMGRGISAHLQGDYDAAAFVFERTAD